MYVMAILLVSPIVYGVIYRLKNYRLRIIYGTGELVQPTKDVDDRRMELMELLCGRAVSIAVGDEVFLGDPGTAGFLPLFGVFGQNIDLDVK
jgi:hypothetical protein